MADAGLSGAETSRQARGGKIQHAREATIDGMSHPAFDGRIRLPLARFPAPILRWFIRLPLIYIAAVTQSSSADELTGLRNLLERVQSGELRILRGEEDVTESQLSILRREIAFLNGVLVWLKAGGRVAPGLKSGQD